jgi:hypothetical protein
LSSDLRSTAVRLATVWILVASQISFNLWIYTYIQALVVLHLHNTHSFGAKCNLLLINALHKNGNEMYFSLPLIQKYKW